MFGKSNNTIKNLAITQIDLKNLLDKNFYIGNEQLVNAHIGKIIKEMKVILSERSNYTINKKDMVVSNFFIQNEWMQQISQLEEISKERNEISIKEFVYLWRELIFEKEIKKVTKKEVSALISTQEIQKTKDIYRTFFENENSCFECVESIGIITVAAAPELKEVEGKFYITIQLEPHGEMTLYGNSVLDIANAWFSILKNQPKDMTYIEASYYLNNFNKKYKEDLFFPSEESFNILEVNINPETFWQERR